MASLCLSTAVCAVDAPAGCLVCLFPLRRNVAVVALQFVRWKAEVSHKRAGCRLCCLVGDSWFLVVGCWAGPCAVTVIVDGLLSLFACSPVRLSNVSLPAVVTCRHKRLCETCRGG